MSQPQPPIGPPGESAIDLEREKAYDALRLTVIEGQRLLQSIHTLRAEESGHSIILDACEDLLREVMTTLDNAWKDGRLYG